MDEKNTLQPIRGAIVNELVCDDDMNGFSDSCNSSDEDENVIGVFLNLKEKNARICIERYCEEVVLKYPNENFVRHFRMRRPIVEYLTKQFSQSNWYLTLQTRSNSRCNITPMKHILVFLWFAGHQTASYGDVADRFNLSLSSLHDVITRVMVFLSYEAANVIKFPTRVEKERIMKFYYEKARLQNIIRSIDGCHIKIDKPEDRQVDYINRKGYYSIILQGVCDENLNFTDIFIGYRGSVHDARVFRNSSFYSKLEDCEGGYLLGDSAYPQLRNLLTPYRDNGQLNAANKYYNQKLSSCRVLIEHTFGLLKQRFRQLYHVKLRGHERLCHFIRACCTLHNLANKADVEFFNLEDNVEDLPVNNFMCFRHINETFLKLLMSALKYVPFETLQ